MATAPQIMAVNDDLGPLTGPVANFGFTDDTSPVVVVSISGTAAQVGDQIQLIYPPTQPRPIGPPVILTAANIAAGQVGIPLVGLAAGQYPLQVEMLSAAGVLLSVGAGVTTFNVATAPPPSPTIQQLMLDSGGPLSPIADGHTADTTPLVQVYVPGVSSIATPVLPGHAPYGDPDPVHGGTVLLYANGQLAGQGTIGLWGAVKFDATPLAPGAYSLTVVTVDRAGNASAPSAPVSLTIDGAAPMAPTPASLTASGVPLALSSSSGWTGAVVLSNHALAVVNVTAADFGSSVAGAQSYDSAGVQTGSVHLAGYAGAGQALSPQITGLDGNFYRVGYAGSSDYEIYSAAGQQVFVHNAYTSPTSAFTPLLNGGYVTTDSGVPVFGLFDAAAHNLGWFSLPDAPSGPTVQALAGGGFVLTYPASSHFDLFDSGGRQVSTGDLGAAQSGFATGFAPTRDGGFVEAWLSPDGGQGGLATAIKLQAFDASGAAVSPALSVASDLDPWHTAFVLQAHNDGSAALLWSEGGAVFGAEYAQGVVGAAHPALVGDLTSAQIVPLSDNGVGFAYLQGGDVWAELFDPATGALHRADLGPASGSLSSVHALATANGGLAVSWREGSGVLANVMSSSGAVGVTAAVAGDLIGMDALGRAITLHDDAGAPVLVSYQINDGLFWAA